VREGTLVVANLREESLTVHDLEGDVRSRTLALPAGPHEMVFADGRIYATLARANELVEVDPAAPGVLRSLTLPGSPHGLALDGYNVLITLDDEAALVTVNRATMTETGRTSTGNTPHTVAVSGDRAFVTDSRDNDIRTLPGGETAPTGVLPESVVIAGNLVITGDAASRTLSVFRLDDLAFAGTVALDGSPVRILALDATHAVVALNDTAELAVVDLATLKVERRIPVAERPDGLCLSPTGLFLGVVSNAKDAVTVLRVSDWRVQISLATGHGPGQCVWM
jgi:hypothetical protein